MSPCVCQVTDGVNYNGKERDQNSAKALTIKCQSEYLSLLSYYQVIEHGLQKVLVLEDDVRFEPRFKRRLQAIMDDIDKAQLDWDLM